MVGRPPMRMKNLIVGAIVCASMLIAVPASAQSPSGSAYSKPSGSISERIERKNPPPPDPPTITIREAREGDSDLPFTGLDVAMIVAAGGVLLAMGLGMRRLSRSEVA